MQSVAWMGLASRASSTRLTEPVSSRAILGANVEGGKHNFLSEGSSARVVRHPCPAGKFSNVDWRSFLARKNLRPMPRLYQIMQVVRTRCLSLGLTVSRDTSGADRMEHVLENIAGDSCSDV